MKLKCLTCGGTSEQCHACSNFGLKADAVIALMRARGTEFDLDDLDDTRIFSVCMYVDRANASKLERLVRNRLEEIV